MSRRLYWLAGGGTGGHVIPLLAVARELARRGHQVLFLGTRHGIEARLVPAAGFPIRYIEIGALKRVSALERITTLYRLPLATLRLLGEARPAAVFSIGGYAAGPPVLAAIARRIPLVIMEPNALPGFTNRRIARFVDRALIGFPETTRFFPEGRTEITGVPVREEFFEIRPKPRGDVLDLLVTGGSRGAHTLNVASRESWPLFRSAPFRVRFRLQAGRDEAAALAAEFRDSGLEGEVAEFIEDMPGAFAGADLVVCRSGAGATAELAAAGKPSILCPFPFAADDHQLRNAEALERAGAAKLVLNREMNGRKLYETVAELWGECGALERMGAGARALGRPGAARRAAEILEEFR
jgi:UDP-N-acetylglucosamine--N-acetylmuramyl-(pentapeptide) pyrophosphoryl-undecaprenol N-acetylglucosamine transferase